jgi:hypothetical protein
MTTLSIRRLANRVVASDVEAAWAAAPVLDGAVHRLPSLLDPLLDRVTAIAGLPPDAVLALPRLEIRLPFRPEPERLAEDWAAAIATTLTEACRAAMETQPAAFGAQPAAAGAASPESAAPPGDDDATAAVFADAWEAEAAILGYLAAGLPLPWWAESLSPGSADAARIIGEWIERAPARAAAHILHLLCSASAAGLLTGIAARRLAGRMLQRLAMGVPSSQAGRTDRGSAARGWSEFRAQVPVELAMRAAAMPADPRALFNLAALMVHAPAATLVLGQLGRSAEQIEEAIATLAAVPEAPGSPAPSEPLPMPLSTPSPSPERAIGVNVMNGGLLLLVRPVLELRAVASAPPSELPALLSGIGLLALQRVSAPLPPAARRVLLERDRPLLAAFAGADPPDAPLDSLPVSTDAVGALDEVLAAAPETIGWAPGALLRYYGGADPFSAAPDGRLARLLLRPGRLVLTRWSAELTWPLATADIALRRAGWDIDAGWLPWIGRVVRFRYDGADDA